MGSKSQESLHNGQNEPPANADSNRWRDYQETHPWIEFRFDMRPAPAELWMLLGEARSKIAHIAGSLLNPEVAERMHIAYLAKGALATTAIEGNTLSEEEARRRIERRLDLPPSREYLGREIDNIVVAFNAIKDELVTGEIPVHPVAVGGYVGAPRKDCELLLEKLSDWLNGADFAPASSAWEIPMAIAKAILAHLYVAWIHPFGDGNGRTARLMELRILLEAGVPTPAAHLLSNHYSQTRSEYYRQLRNASREDGGLLLFVRYAVQGFVDGLRDQLQMIRSQQFADRWEQYVYQQFGRATTPARLRQRQLVLEMSKIDEPLTREELPSLSRGLIQMYGAKTGKALTRDINAVVRMGLVRRQGRGYVPNKRVIEAFLPVMAETNDS